MCTNGSRRRGSAAANARRTGKPSPSTPCGAVVTLRTDRSRAASGSGRGIWGRTVMSSTVTAGMSRLRTRSQRERLDRGQHRCTIVPVHAGDVDVELDLVAVRVLDVQAVADRVVAHSGHAHTSLLAATQRGAQLVVAVADLHPEVVQAEVAPVRHWLRVLPHLDEQ